LLTAAPPALWWVMAKHIAIPIETLSQEAIDGLVEEFITREGTDYGEREHSLVEKRATVMRQLARGQIAIVFDFESESTTLVTREELLRMGVADAESDDDAQGPALREDVDS
jgi:uncharacterized protein